MKNKIKLALGSIAFCLSNIVMADDAINTSLFTEFSKCDANFFKAIATHADYLKDYTQIERVDSVARIVVKDRLLKSDASTDLKRPLQIKGLNFKTYFENFSDLGSLGMYYYWGFRVEGSSVEDVADKLRTAVYDNAKFIKENDTYLRTEVKVGNSPWMRLPTSNGPVGLMRIERMFNIEKNPENNDITVSCSIQGGVRDATLKEIRPDIAAKDYPSKLSATLFEDTKVPDNVTAEINRAKTINPFWKSKYKNISYSYIGYNPDKPSKYDNDPSSVDLKILPNGLIQKRESYGDLFTVDRLMFADMFQLKSRINGLGEGTVFLTTQLNLAIPSKLEVGAKIVEKRSGVNMPLSEEEKKNDSFENICTIAERVSASSISPNIKGMASMMQCSTVGEKGSFVSAYLEDYGVSMSWRRTDKDGAKTIYKIIQFDAD